MRCVKCGHKAKTVGSGTMRCHECGHTCVADKKRDGIGDGTIKKIIEKLATAKAPYFLQEQLGYEMHRRMYGTRASKVDKLIGVVILLAMLAGFWYLKWWIAVGIIGLILLGMWDGSTDADKPFELAKSYLKFNPSTHLVPKTEEALKIFEKDNTEQVKVAFDKVLVCEQQALADMLRMNQFHLNSACPVIGPGGNDDGAYPGLIQKLKQREISVFVLHNLSGEGLAFMGKIINSPEWFGEHDKVNIVDLGLFPDQLPMLGKQFRPLSSMGSSKQFEVDGLPKGMGVEVSTFSPGVLLSMMAAGILALLPMALPAQEPSSVGSETGNYE